MKTQRGVTLVEIAIVLVILAVLAGGAAAVVTTYNRTLAENEQLKTKNETLTEAHQDQLVENAGLIARQELLDKQLAARQATDQRLAALERKLNDALGKLYAQSPEARKWAASPIPDDVRRIVRARANGGTGSDQDQAGAAAAPVVKPDAGTAVPRSDVYQRRPAGVRPAVGVKPQ
jgi:prepilin-type N-terminal cleavage/methylation domain-containing protein